MNPVMWSVVWLIGVAPGRFAQPFCKKQGFFNVLIKRHSERLADEASATFMSRAKGSLLHGPILSIHSGCPSLFQHTDKYKKVNNLQRIEKL